METCVSKYIPSKFSQTKVILLVEATLPASSITGMWWCCCLEIHATLLGCLHSFAAQCYEQGENSFISSCGISICQQWPIPSAQCSGLQALF